MADAELEALVQKYERRYQPRARAELEAIIATLRAEWKPKVERYNYLVERKARCEAELAALGPDIDRYENASHDLDWEYFRRLQLDGALPSLPQVIRPADDNHKNDEDVEEEDDDECSNDFEAREER